MNTSHNKNRVIEHGWKNVFKNILGKFGSQPQIIHEGCNDKTCNNKRKVKDGKDKQDLIQLIQGFRQKVTDLSKDSLKNI